jgi:hypothetical protein
MRPDYPAARRGNRHRLRGAVVEVAVWPVVPPPPSRPCSCGPAWPEPALLRRLHSGHVGDYVAWLFAGVAALGVLIGLPLL